MNKLYSSLYVVKEFFLKEKILTILLIVYTALAIYNHGFLAKNIYYVDYRSIVMIYLLMMISRSLELSGYITVTAYRIVSCCTSLRSLCLLLMLFSMAIASILMNDTALFIAMPLVLSVSRITSINPVKLVILSTITVNIGSALSPIGNPQNIIIWQYYRLSIPGFIKFTVVAFIPAIVALILYAMALTPGMYFKKPTKPPLIKRNKSLAVSSILLLTITIVSVELGFIYIALTITIMFYLLYRKEIVTNLDYVLILIFILMFMDFRGIADLLSITSYASVSLFVEAIVLSQIVSNVPATIMLLGGDWHILLLGVNIGGVGFITGSLANLIAIRLTGIKISDFHRITLPYFTVLTIVHSLYNDIVSRIDDYVLVIVGTRLVVK